MSEKPADTRPIFDVALRPEPDVTDPVRALRLALKALLRRYRMRAIQARERGE